MDLQAEFELWQKRNPGHELIQHLNGLGVSDYAIEKASLAVMPIEIFEHDFNFFDYEEGGIDHIIQPVWFWNFRSKKHEIFDLVAWHPKNPKIWHFRKGIGNYLGTHGASCHFEGNYPVLFTRTPLEFLLWDCEGVMPLWTSDGLCMGLKGFISAAIAQDDAHARIISKLLKLGDIETSEILLVGVFDHG